MSWAVLTSPGLATTVALGSLDILAVKPHSLSECSPNLLCLLSTGNIQHFLYDVYWILTFILMAEMPSVM